MYLVPLAAGTACVLAHSPAPAICAAEKREQRILTDPVRAGRLSVTTRLVTVSVVARDKQGNPVIDLTRDDFILLEESKPQNIETFEIESNRFAVTPRPVLPPGTYANRIPGQHSPPTAASVILMDAVNTRIANRNYAREKIVAFLGQIEARDRIAIYALDRSGLYAVHDFSADCASLLAALSRYRASYPFGLDPVIPTAPAAAARPSASDNEGAFADRMNRFLSQAEQAWTDLYDTQRVQATTAAFRAIASRLSRFPGRKNLIWISSGLPLTTGSDAMAPLIVNTPGRRFSREVEQAARELSSAGVVVYPVDARGLMGAASARAMDRGGASLARGRPPVFEGSASGTDAMRLFAAVTGGRAFHDRNDIDRAVRNAVDEARCSYTLGYYPAHGKWDGRFVRIAVKTKRPGVEIRARSGYYAAAKPPSGDRELVAQLEDAAAGPFDATAVGIAVRVTRFREAAANTLKLAIDIDPRDVSLVHEHGRWTGGLDLMLVQQSADGTVVSRRAQAFDLRFSPEEYDRLQRNGLVIDHAAEVHANAQRLRIVVHDSRSGAFGSVTVPLSEVP